VLSFGFKNDQFVHDFASDITIGNQNRISGRPHNNAFGTRHIVKPSFSVVLGVKLFCGGVQIFEDFTLCDLNNCTSREHIF
jgi:hypothetical protein